MTRACLTDILKLLKGEGYNVRISAATILKTRRHLQVIRPMESGKGTMGKYVYIGAEEHFKEVIPEEYTIRSIKLLFNIDGLPIYNRSSIQFWGFLGKVYDNEYESWPFNYEYHHHILWTFETNLYQTVFRRPNFRNVYSSGRWRNYTR